MAEEILRTVLNLIITYGLVCLMILFFALACGFEWNIFLCSGVWMAMVGCRWITRRGDE